MGYQYNHYIHADFIQNRKGRQYRWGFMNFQQVCLYVQHEKMAIHTMQSDEFHQVPIIPIMGGRGVGESG